MFHQAKAKYDAGATKQKTLSQKLFSSSSPPRSHEQSQQQSHHSSGLRLGKARANKISSIHGSFETESNNGSFSKPIIIDENSPARVNVPKVSSTEFFEEDDFDSDIDLDVEDPTLMNQLRSSASKRAFSHTAQGFHPTQPRQQQVGVRHQAISLDDSGYDSFSNKAFEKAPGSSAAIPWSSSPPEHTRPVTPSKNMERFAYTNQPTFMPTLPEIKDEVKPVKRRTIPWKAADEQQAQMEQNGPPPPLGQSKGAASLSSRTPQTKSSSALWNTSTSAVKEQLRAFREVNKKKSKFVEATDEIREIIEADRQVKKHLPRVFLSDEQQHVLDLVVESKKSVFFTGSAGTGKSVLLREIIATLRKKHLREPDRVAVTASTGLAACNIGGVTLHSFAGIGLGKEAVPELVKKIRRNQKAKQRWLRTKILIVDEVSMVDGDLFDKLETIARTIRNNGRPFGGIQLVITGDFFQLPPVPDSNKLAKFAFDASSWTTTIHHTIGLHQVFRQKDPVFAGMLNEMREGRLSQSSIDAFQRLSRPLDSSAGNIMATELFPTRKEVENANENRMGQLVGDVKTFEARDGGTILDKSQRDRLLQNCMAPEIIQLKKGAQVMLIKNIDETLVNGSIGKVIGFMSESTFDRYTAHEDEFTVTQGGGLKDTESEAVDPLATRTTKAASRILDNLAGSTTQLFPVVRFTLNDNTTRDLLCQREMWKIELPNGEVQASRSQVPLILAWALSIHKAQGQTLERVKVDLGKVFEKGQAYVALSRATSMGGLQVLRFDAKKVVAHEKVKTFYSNLSRAEVGNGSKKKRKTAQSGNDHEDAFM
ncbi:hypothetical protein ANO11243_070800 [Dothideomycetidae sp. 11243]|nr:hypothetical protein ANO11243_070800 [fungal sp. No.11243]